jgi:hypothetical protein
MVTLYVAAPGVSPADEDTDGHAGIDPDPAAAAAAPAVVPQADAPQAPARARRRRKPGLAGTAPQVSDTPPDPVSRERVMAGEAEAPAAETAVTDAWGLETEARAPIPPDGDEYSEGVPDDQWDDELSHDELVVHADDLFAGRVSQEWPPLSSGPRSAGRASGVGECSGRNARRVGSGGRRGGARKSPGPHAHCLGPSQRFSSSGDPRACRAACAEAIGRPVAAPTGPS